MGPTELVLILLLLALYFIPTIVAASRNHPNGTPIAVLNIFLGWTFIGWVVALIWAVMAIEKRP